ncbi:MAG: histidine kinase dimerization/phospho-acceptor domain-containing protein, partial [Pseudomonadota bacterium]
MNLKRQLLLVSLLTLILPWAGCEFIRETESALREVQQDMLGDTARALASSLTQYVDDFPPTSVRGTSDDRVYLHTLSQQPEIDGYFDDWPLSEASLQTLRGPDGPVRFAIGESGTDTFLFVEVIDRNVVYAAPRTTMVEGESPGADRVHVVSSNPITETFVFEAEAPGPIITYRRDRYASYTEAGIAAHWQDFPDGYRIEARIPSNLLGANLGILVRNTDDAAQSGTRIVSFNSQRPGPTARTIAEITAAVEQLVPDDMRIMVTDADGWRIASTGELPYSTGPTGNVWPRRVYDLLLEPGKDAEAAEPRPLGRETQTYVNVALDGRTMPGWFRSQTPGQAIIAVAAPVTSYGDVIGALILQQTTDAILSQTNAGLARLINVTLISTLIVAGVLLGYATWLSRRIRRLSYAAENALEKEQLQSALPDALADDEIGDLSRSFSYVLRQLDDYNAYLRTLASKLSHELRTPLAIVTSSLENLEHESLNDASSGYVARGREGAERLRRILSAMSEASRVEELMAHAEPEVFDLARVLHTTTDAYRDVYTERNFEFDCKVDAAPVNGSPELLIQMLDKLVDNAVSFSNEHDAITIALEIMENSFAVSVTNP